MPRRKTEGPDQPPRRRAARKTTAARKTAPDRSVVKGRVRAHDPFELIRWVAFSQTDPRKALAELVQNSLDAAAPRVHVSRFRHKGALCLRIFDDGLGVIPEMDRPEALKYIATHIGHSRKRSLSPRERLALMTQGQYGIGLLGFWCLGESLEMRSAIPGQKAHRLILYRDRPEYRVEPLRLRLPFEERWTEVIVSGLHPEAARILVASRAADYLAVELRGQLLARDVELLVEDRIARGRARKRILVQPRRFLGERIEGLDAIHVPEHPPIRIEVYYTGASAQNGDGEGIGVYASGTLVAEGFHELGVLDLDRAPWTDPRLTGMIDFPGFHVAPGSRRGVIPDEAAEAFVHALRPVEKMLAGLLESYDRRRSEQIDRLLLRDLQRAFRDFYRQRPSYAMLPVGQEGDVGAGPSGPGLGPGAAGTGPGSLGEAAAVAAESAGTALPDADSLAEGDEDLDDAGNVLAVPVDQELLPPGPLATVQVTPPKLRVACGGRRRVKAIAVDATGRPVEGEVRFEWTLRVATAETGGPLAEPTRPFAEIADLHTPAGPIARATLIASDEPAQGLLIVKATSGSRSCATEVPIEILEELPGRRSSEGIPEPELVDQPGESWRSRMADGRWQVNSGHRDYRAVADRPRLKLRYLARLFAKEVVLRNHQDPRLELPLEQMIEVMSYADLRISSARTRGRKASRSEEGEG